MPLHSLYWFTQDLRITDNQALFASQNSETLTCIYIVDPRKFKALRWQLASLGPHRWSFIQDSLSDLSAQLHMLGQRLHVYYGEPETIIPRLCHQYHLNHLICTRLPGSDEKRQLRSIQASLPQLKIEQFDNYTLFEAEHLPCSTETLPETFSGFRRQAEAADVKEPLRQADSLPLMPKLFALPAIQRPSWVPIHPSCNTSFKGGETEAQRHLAKYFSGTQAQRYKASRNELDGWQNSSKLSAWLNQGCLSPRQLKFSLNQYEQSHGENDSTRWLYLELLWREYFQWLHSKIGTRLFHFKGLAKNAPLTSFYPERFKKWCHGQTPYPLVNACMNELRTTGYLSNRGRQIVASCLVNELSLDWRYGAAWFEHQLIDYDVAINWGNWQYIAGVGVDPRGGRHFNLEKQTELYDPLGQYRKKWGGTNAGPLDSVDAADWPII